MIRKKYVILAKTTGDGMLELEFNSENCHISLENEKITVKQGDKCIFYAKEESVIMIYEKEYIDCGGKIELYTDGIKLC